MFWNYLTVEPQASSPSPQRLPARRNMQVESPAPNACHGILPILSQQHKIARRCLSILKLLFQVQVGDSILHVAANQILC